MESTDTIFADYNIIGRIEHAPLNATLFVIYSIGVFGNALVIHVFWKRFSEHTPYRAFVSSLAGSDLFSSFGHCARCVERLVFVYHQTGPINSKICKAIRFLSYANGLASFLLIFALGVDRYKKICTPLKLQMTFTQSKIICVLSFVVGVIFNSPVMFLIGRLSYEIKELNITATRCSIPNELQASILPLLFYGAYFTIVLLCIVVMGVIQYKIIQSLIKHAKFRREMRNITSGTNAPRHEPTGSLPLPRRDINSRNREIAIALIVITLLMLISFASITALQTYNAFMGFFVPVTSLSVSEDMVNEFVLDLVAVNGVLNPVVYFLLDLKFRKEVKAIFVN
jgi:hypothetical protein